MTAATFEATDYSGILTSAIKGICSGIAPHCGGAETEEYRVNVPIWLRRRDGTPADELADMLKDMRPELGIESEVDLYRELSRAALQRRDATAAAAVAPVSQTTEQAREQAIADFRWALGLIDREALEVLRAAWRMANRAVGHRALAHVLLEVSE